MLVFFLSEHHQAHSIIISKESGQIMFRSTPERQIQLAEVAMINNYMPTTTSRTAALFTVALLWLCACYCPRPCCGLAAERRPWEVLRFVQQSSKFVRLPFVGGTAQTKAVRPGDVLWTAGSGGDGKQSPQASPSFTMAPLDDVVMGGASASTFDANTGTWSGTVTDANNGGFIGIRSTPTFQWDCNSCQGLEWKVKLMDHTSSAAGPDSKKKRRFKFVLRDSTDFNGITWTTSVDLQPGRVGTVKIPFGKQVPALFARTVPGQTFQRENVVGVQISFSKFEYDGDLNPNFSLGDVKLQLLELRAY